MREWYVYGRCGAFAMDVLSIVIAVYAAMLLAPRSGWAQLGIAIGFQLAHDLTFGAYVRSKWARGPLMRLFGRYAREMGLWVLGTDMIMVAVTLGLAHALHNGMPEGTQALLGVIVTYMGLLLVYNGSGQELERVDK